jgi:phage gp16-like protein
VTAAPDHRRRELALIHIAKKQLDLDDDTYRAMLWTVGRVHSSGDLDYAGRQRVLEHLRACGFKARGHGKKPTVRADRAAQLSKIEALLADAGLPWDYLTHGKDGKPSMVKRICRVEKIEWCSAEQLGKLIAALVIAQRRKGDA